MKITANLFLYFIKQIIFKFNKAVNTIIINTPLSCPKFMMCIWQDIKISFNDIKVHNKNTEIFVVFMVKYYHKYMHKSKICYNKILTFIPQIRLANKKILNFHKGAKEWCHYVFVLTEI